MSNRQKNEINRLAPGYNWRTLLWRLFFSLLVAGSAPLWAKTTAYTIADLEKAAENYIQGQLSVADGEKIIVKASKQDPRIQIDPCNQPLQISGAENRSPGRNITVKIVCENPQWRQYIPVRIGYYKHVVVALTQLETGQIITSDLLDEGLIDTLQLRGSHFSHKAELIGAKIKQRVNSGEPILTQQICLVCKKDPVTLIVRSGGLELKTEGTALSDGALGERVQVENKKSKRRLSGRVVGIGLVQIY